VVVCRDIGNAENCFGIAVPLGIVHGFLVGKKGETLSKKDRETGQTDIFERIMAIFSLSFVGKRVN